MVKRKIVETIEEFDDSGKLIKRTVTETEESNDTLAYPGLHAGPYDNITWREYIERGPF